MILVAVDAAAAGDAQGLPGEQPAGVHRLRQGPSRRAEFGSAGVGSAIHLGCVLFNAAAGIDATHIPYRGGDPAMQDIIAGGSTTAATSSPAPTRRCATRRSRRRRCSAPHRAPLLPDLATAQEQGMAGFRRRKLERHLPAQGHAGADRRASSTPPSARRWIRRKPRSGCSPSASTSRRRTAARRPMPRASSNRRSRNTRRPIKASGIVIE